MTLRRVLAFGALLLISIASAFSQTTVFILSQPISQSAYFGQNVTFSVSAFTLGQSLSYQWQKDGVSITGANGSLLSLSNAQSNNVGAYTVIVSDNLGGSVTSSPPAVLTLKPAGMSIALHPGITIDGAVGRIYGIQFTTDLSDINSWHGLTNINLSASPQTWYDPQPAVLPTRYYRILQGPIPIP